MKSTYNPEVHPKLAAQYALDGLTDKEICGKLGISKPTYYDWQKKFPDFLNSTKKNKAVVDYEAEQALYTRVMGKTYTETKCIYQVDKEGKEVLVRKEVTNKHILPDTLACLAWLRNRQRDKWKFNPDVALEHNEGTLNDLVETLKKANHSS